MNNEEFLAELRTSVVAADERHRSATPPAPTGRGRSLRWLAAAAVVLLVAGSAIALRPAPAGAGLEIIPDETGLTLRLTDLATRPEEVERVAREAGLDVTVVEQPVGPGMVGKFIALTASAYVDRVSLTQGDDSSGFTAFRLPLGFDGAVEITMGRPARDGEDWAQVSDATTPGELLECQDLGGKPLDEVYRAAQDAGADSVRVMSMDTGKWLSSEQREEYRDATVLNVWSAAPGHIEIDVSEEPERFLPDYRLPDGC